MQPSKIIVILLAFFLYSNAYATVKEDIAKTIVMVRSGNKRSTGFFWKNGNTIITTLHSLANVNNIDVYIPKIHDWRHVVIKKSLKHSDLLMLQISGYNSLNYISNRYSINVPIDTKAFTIGYNSGNVSYQDRDFTVGLLQGNRLADLLTSSAANEITMLGFPDLNTEIVYLDGSLLHGFSGAPVVDNEGKLIGVADGGLENGAAAISWCIHAKQIANLESSTESVPILNHAAINTLFTAEIPNNNLGNEELVNFNDFSFKKIKTRTFRQLDQTGNYSTYTELGLKQLLGMFQNANIDFNQFTYDIYLEQKTGATIVIPSGLSLQKEGEFITATTADGSYKIFIQINDSYNVQQASINFERIIQQSTNTFNWMADLRLSFLQPLIRPDNVIINRKAYYVPTSYDYGLEALAGKNTTFMGIFVRLKNQFNPMTGMFIDKTAVAKYNLGVQLTTFSN